MPASMRGRHLSESTAAPMPSVDVAGGLVGMEPVDEVEQDVVRTSGQHLGLRRGGPSKLGKGFAQFVKVRDDDSATPLHLAARRGGQGRADVTVERCHSIRFDKLIIWVILLLFPLARGSAQLAPLPQSGCGC